MECGKFEKYIKLAMLECADRDSELFCTIDTSGVAVLPRLEKRILKLIGQRTKAGVNRFSYKRRRALRVVGVIAAVILMFYLSFAVYASTKGISMQELIVRYFDRFANMEPGESFELGGVTLTKGSGSKEYESLDEAMREGNIEVMYPSALPVGVRTTGVYQTFYNKEETVYTISFYTTSDKIKIYARNHLLTDIALLESHPTYQVGDLTYYIAEDTADYGIFIANCLYEGFQYYVETDNLEDLILIIENMKKVS